MRLPQGLRSLQIYSVIWIVLPLALVITILVTAGVITFQQVMTSLVIDRDRQLAVLSARSFSEIIDGNVRVLEALAKNIDPKDGSTGLPAEAFQSAAEALDIFNAGMWVVSEDGSFRSGSLSRSPPLGQNIFEQEFYKVLVERQTATFSNVILDAGGGEEMIIIAVPIFDEDDSYSGALLGMAYLQTSPLGDPFKGIVVGKDGLAYLVDKRGQVIFHPDPALIGADFSDRPFVVQVIETENGGRVWKNSQGKRLVEGYAPVARTGWGLIIEESWDSAVSAVRAYDILLIFAGLTAITAATLLSLVGVERIATPIRHLSAQTIRLTKGEEIHPVIESGIREIDTLENAFDQMAQEIASYRAGLHLYVGAITKSQEEERRRIARELHDETVQSLLAISRRLELGRASGCSPEQLSELQDMVTDTLRGVRQISKDMRPLLLEDLGLISALKALVRAMRTGVGAIPHAKLEITGEPKELGPERELAIYRITQEALTNIRKHSRATGVEVELIFDETAIRLCIRDDGDGFKVPDTLVELAQRGCFGLIGIQERVLEMNGTLEVQSKAAQGTTLSVDIPLGQSKPVAQVLPR